MSSPALFWMYFPHSRSQLEKSCCRGTPCFLDASDARAFGLASAVHKDTEEHEATPHPPRHARHVWTLATAQSTQSRTLSVSRTLNCGS